MATSNAAAISVGAVLGDSDRESMAWSEAIGSLSMDVIRLRDGLESPVSVQVVFHVDGGTAPNDFHGVRTGRYDPRRRCLTVQAAVPKDPDGDRRAVLVAALTDAVAAAEDYARRGGLAHQLPAVRGLVDRLRTDPTQQP